MADEPELKEGAENDEQWVNYLQELLEYHDQWPHGQDGWFGPEVKQAVENFQNANSLTADGVVGQTTWQKLAADPSDGQDEQDAAGAAGGSEGTQAGAGNAGADGQAVEVDHSVQIVMQTTDNTCWAACCAMLLSTTEDDVVQQVGNAGGDGADEPEMEAISSALGLNIVPPMSMAPEGWASLLEIGPVMVGIPRHYIVVSGVKSDGSFESAKLHVLDPAQGENWIDFQTVEQQYEIDADSGANLLQK